MIVLGPPKKSRWLDFFLITFFVVSFGLFKFVMTSLSAIFVQILSIRVLIHLIAAMRASIQKPKSSAEAVAVLPRDQLNTSSQ
jgi:hypothetical protein